MSRAKNIRRVLIWFALLLALVAVAGGSFAWWMWTQADEKLRQAIITKQQELAPEWDVEIPRAHFDWSRRVHIYDVTIRAKGHAAPVLRLPEIVITIDRERFRASQEVIIQKVRLIRPEAHLVRSADGRWNWHDLLNLPKSKRPSPEFEIEQGRIRVQLERPEGGTPAVIAMDQCRLQLVPAARRQYAISGEGQVNEAGRLEVRGRWDLDAHRWNIHGSMHEVATSGELLRLVAGVSPELRSKLWHIDAALQRYVDSTQAPAAGAEPLAATAPASEPADRQADADSLAGIPPVPETIPDFGIRCTLDMDFQVSQTERGAEPDFRMAVRLRQGQLDHDALPFPLRDVEGVIDWDNRHIVLRRLTATNGVTQLSLSGRFERQDAATPGHVDVRISRLPLDERLRRRLPPLLGRQFDLLQLTGHVDLTAACVYGESGKWTYRDVLLTALGCGASSQRFPYPVRDVVGTVRQGPAGDFAVRLEGRAGRQPVLVVGAISQPGPEAEARFEIRASKLPIDDRFREACPPAVRKTLAALRAQGSIDAAVRLHRPPGLNQPFRTDIALSIEDGTVEVSAFPYRVSRLSGRIVYRWATKLWTFRELQGRHGDAALTAQGVFRQDRSPAVLDLQIVAENAHLDNELKGALPEPLQRLWDDLQPTGRVDALEVRLAWSPDGPVQVTIPHARISGGSLKLAAFPWWLTDVSTELSYANNRVEFTSLDGWHDETHVWIGAAAGLPAGQAIAEDDGGWQLRFENLHVDDLTVDRRFRETLPPELRSVIEQLDPTGPPLSLEGMVHVRSGGPELPVVTAAWDLSVYFAGSSLSVGTELDDLHGRVATSGTWDGRRVDAGGELDLDSVYVLDYQFTQIRGPFQILDDRVAFGSPQALALETPALRSAASRDQITARAIGGVVTVNGDARLGARPTYELRIVLRDGRLEQYARQYLPGTSHLAGVMNGDLSLVGRGPAPQDLTGRGVLRISPAALYELPVIARVLGTLNTLAPPEKTAFKYADLEFDIAQSQFRFRRIDLVGDALSLRGRGSVGFDGQVRLDFYSMMPRTRLPIGAIPGVNAILGEATKGWVGVRVRGKTSDPQADPTYVPVLDETLRGFLKAFEGAPASMTPRLAPPFLPPTRWQFSRAPREQSFTPRPSR